MKFLKKLLALLKEPTAGIICIVYPLTALSIAGAITLMVLGLSEEVYSYIVYGLSALSLGYTIYTIVKFAPYIKAKTTEELNRHSFTQNLLRDYGYRTTVVTIFSFIFNALYAFFMEGFAIYSRSFWYGALAFYYIILAIMRGVLLKRKSNVNKILDDYERAHATATAYRITGILLVVLTFGLIGAVSEVVFFDYAFNKPGLTIYAFAAYAFYKIVMAVINMVKSSKQSDDLVMAIRHISLADAVVSIMALQTALLSTFGGNDVTAFRWANGATGIVVCLITIILGVVMIIKANKTLKGLNTNE